MSALKIVELQSENVLQLNLEEFKQILTKDDLAERSLVVISIAGAMRKGKSFLLNFLLTYAYNKYPTAKMIVHPKRLVNGSYVDGFSQCGGPFRHTTGIQVWPDIFLHDNPDGKKIAILFMDTQGTFDFQTKFGDCVLIFALSTLLSSVQIYNISNNIQNDHLQYLALFAEYAKLALGKISPSTDNATPFDSLQILVRDWNYPYQAGYGLAGGKQILDKTFTSNNPEVQKLVSSITDKFTKIDCFLMPFPGEAIATSSKFDGLIKNVDQTFLDYVAILNRQLLSPESLQIKYINGVELKVGNFAILLEQAFEILSKCENIPKPKTIMEATAESQSYKLIEGAVDKYKMSMSSHLAGNRYLGNREFMSLHEKYLNESMEFYENTDKLDNHDSETNEQFKTMLQESIIRETNYLLIANEKNLPNTSAALQTLITVAVEEKLNELNSQHTQDILNIIKTFRDHEVELQEHIIHLTREFKQSPSSGFQFMAKLKKMINVVRNGATRAVSSKKNVNAVNNTSSSKSSI